MKNLALNPKFKIKKVNIPNTELYAYIIDDFILNTNSIMHFAQNIAYFNPTFSDNSYYPGVRDNMPLPYGRLLKKFFEEYILPKFINEAGTINLHKCLLSLVACRPNQLTIDQKMPHIDSYNNKDFAFVHYLSGKELGGTSIYKYKPRNKTEITVADKKILDEMLIEVANYPEEHRGYITQSTPLFEQVLNIEAKFNRLVIYQGNLLHSANLDSPLSYCGDKRTGRLSISSFGSLLTN